MPINNEKTPKSRDELLALLRADAKNAIKLLRQKGVEEKKLYDYAPPIIDHVFAEHAYLENHKKYGRLEYMDIDANRLTKVVIGIVNLLEKVNAHDVAIDLLHKTLNRDLLPSLYQSKYHDFFKTKSCAEKLQKYYSELSKQKYFENPRFLKL